MGIFRNRLTERHEVEIRKASILRFLEGLFLGLSIGSLIGLMLAPKSGKDTLLDIKNTSNKLKDGVIQKGKLFRPTKNSEETSEEIIEE